MFVEDLFDTEFAKDGDKVKKLLHINATTSRIARHLEDSIKQFSLAVVEWSQEKDTVFHSGCWGRPVRNQT